MTKMMIKLNSIKKIIGFVNIADQYSGEISVASGDHTVNGKSLLGIFSLDLKNNLTLEIESGTDLFSLIQKLDCAGIIC